jgi:hypothetical protein
MHQEHPLVVLTEIARFHDDDGQQVIVVWTDWEGPLDRTVNPSRPGTASTASSIRVSVYLANGFCAANADRHFSAVADQRGGDRTTRHCALGDHHRLPRPASGTASSSAVGPMSSTLPAARSTSRLRSRPATGDGPPIRRPKAAHEAVTQHSISRIGSRRPGYRDGNAETESGTAAAGRHGSERSKI